jgi:hypothetical protein
MEKEKRGVGEKENRTREEEFALSPLLPFPFSPLRVSRSIVLLIQCN